MFYYDANTASHTLYLQSKISTGHARPPKAKMSAALGSSIAAEYTDGGDGGDAGSSYVTDKAAAQQAKYHAARPKWIPAARGRIGDETKKINPLAYSTRRERGIRAEQKPEKRDHLVLAYCTTNGGCCIVLRGLNEH